MQKWERVCKGNFEFGGHRFFTEVQSDLTQTVCSGFHLNSQSLGLFNLFGLGNCFLNLAEEVNKYRTLFHADFSSQHIQGLDATGALKNRCNFAIPGILFNQIIFRIAGTSKDLNRLDADFMSSISHIFFNHRGQHRK